MIKIYADFNNSDEHGRVRLNSHGSLEDLEKYEKELDNGMEVILYMDEEFEVKSILKFDNIWLGIPNWETIQYYS